MKKIIYIFICTLIISCSFTKESCVYSAKISNNIELCFLNYNHDFNLYSKPRINKNGKLFTIQGYDDMNYTGIDSTLDIKISENKNYIKMDNIIKGYVQLSEKDSILHENYQCVIISIKESKVIYINSDVCDGEWQKNKWVKYNGEVEFDGN